MNNVTIKEEILKLKREDVEDIAAFISPPKAFMDHLQL